MTYWYEDVNAALLEHERRINMLESMLMELQEKVEGDKEWRV